MALVLFLLGTGGFTMWLLRKPTGTQISSLGVMTGAMFLYGSFLPNLLGLPNPYGVTLAFLLSILTSVGVEKMRQVR